MQLFINTYGAYVHVKQQMFEVKVKNSKEKTSAVNHISAKKVSGIVMSKGTALSSDAIALALENNIDIVVMDKYGNPMGRFWHSKLGSTTKIRKRQLEYSLHAGGVHWVKKWQARKIENQIEKVKKLKKHRVVLRATLDQLLDRMIQTKYKIEEAEAESVSEIADTLRGWEGTCGRYYFNALALCIPKEFVFAGRSSRPADDPFNAMLNYSYGILYSKVERALMLAGLDPYLGFFHRDDYNTKSLVFDFIEPYRIYAEEYVFRLFSAKKIKKSYFDKLKNGFSLNEDGKAFFVPGYLEYIDSQKIRYRGRLQTRMNALQMDAHKFANQLIKE